MFTSYENVFLFSGQLVIFVTVKPCASVQCSYRASNEGKFPTITNIRQQIGGSHYTVYEVLSEMKYNHAKLQLGNPKSAPLQGTVEVTEHPMQKVEARVLESQVSEQSMAKDDAEVSQHQGTVEVSENSLPKDEGKVDQLQGTESESFKDLTV